MSESIQRPEANPKPSSRRKIALGLSAVVLSSTISTAAANEHLYSYDEQAIGPPEIEGCEVDKPMPRIFTPSDATIEFNYKDVTSAARKASVKAEPEQIEKPSQEISISETVNSMFELMRHRQGSFELADTGIEMHLYSDSDMPLSIDTDTFNELFMAPLEHSRHISHGKVAKQMECMAERAKDGEFSGEDVHLFIPSSSEGCLGALRLMRSERKHTDEPNDCMAFDFTPPPVNLRADPFGIIEKKLRLVVIAAGGGSAQSVERRSAHIAVHSAAHFWMNFTEPEFRVDPDERVAKMISDSLVDKVYDGSPPTFIEY